MSKKKDNTQKPGHEWVSKGFDAKGNEHFDLIIKSPHDLKAYARDQRAENKEFIDSQKDTVWTPFGREKINPEYLAAGVALRAQQKAEREADPEWMAHDALTKEQQVYNYYKHKDNMEKDELGLLDMKPEQLQEKLKEMEQYKPVRNPNIRWCKSCYPKCAGHPFEERIKPKSGIFPILTFLLGKLK